MKKSFFQGEHKKQTKGGEEDADEVEVVQSEPRTDTRADSKDDRLQSNVICVDRKRKERADPQVLLEYQRGVLNPIDRGYGIVRRRLTRQQTKIGRRRNPRSVTD